MSCHTDNAAGSDFVFTQPGTLPGDAQIAAAGAAPNGLELPEAFRDWRLIGVGRRTDNGSVRIVTGNDLAVNAARAGQPYPDGSMRADLVWTGGASDSWSEMIVPDAFSTVLFMEKDSEQFAADGGWAYANWSGMDLSAPVDADFDAACIGCHTDGAASTDYVFTDAAALP